MSDERAVELKGVDEKAAPGMLHQEGLTETTSDAVAAAVPKFTDVEFPAFRGRYAFIEGNIVIHFFLPSGVGDLRKADATTQRRWEAYWLETFPARLDAVAKVHFQADKRRLAAKYTEELASWWFRARGYGDSLNPKGLTESFLKKLDEALPATG